MKETLKYKIFETKGHIYTWGDIIFSAELRGEMTSVYKRLKDFLLCQMHAEEKGFDIKEDQLQQDSEDFRYEYDLITAEETFQWLEHHHLSQDDFNDYLYRGQYYSSFKNDLAHLRTLYSPPQERIEAILWPELLLNDQLGCLSMQFAQRIAAGIKINDQAVSDECIENKKQSFYTGHRNNISDLDIDEMAKLEVYYELICNKILVSERLQSELETHALSLMKIEVESARFLSLSVAQEVYMCVTEDGEDLKEVAEKANGSFNSSIFLMEDILDETKQRYLSAQPGSFSQVIEEESGIYSIERVINKYEPSLEDEEIKKRLSDKILSSFFDSLIYRHIHWIITPDLRVQS